MTLSFKKRSQVDKMARIRKHDMGEREAEGYSPLLKPVILQIAEEMSGVERSDERAVEQVSEFCSIVDRPEMKLAGIALPITYESRGYGGFYGFEHASCTLNDYFFTKKLAAEGDMALLSRILGERVKRKDIITVRTEVAGDGNYKVLVGFEVENLEDLPEGLPENTEVLTVPACRYAKILINETKRADRTGYEERMHADDYFIDAFRKDTDYVYHSAGLAFNTYDESGDILTKYEPVKIAASPLERFDSLRMKVVVLPEMKIACSVTSPDSEEFVIFKYFGVQSQVFAAKSSRYYLHDYYGFPVDNGVGYNSCFGTRVSSFEDIPDSVEKMTLPGGIYLHITQLEVNGDNPSMAYEASDHLDELFLASRPEYKRDWSRKMIARFRQSNCASVFVPLLKSQDLQERT
jgi:predicted transcriptional regulator YdeE